MNERITAMAPLILLILLAAMTFWLNRLIQGDNPKGPQRHDPDYIVERFKVTRFDTTGKLQHTIVADRMDHFPDDDTTVVATPHLTYHQVPPTEVFARIALMSADGKEVDLVDNVRVVRHGAESAPATVMETRTLKVFPDDEKANTSQPVVITQGKSIINGTGLDLDNKTGITVLRGRVNGTIHRNQIPSP